MSAVAASGGFDKHPPATGFIRQAVEDRAWSVEGIEFVDVQVTYDPHWSPTRIAPEIAGLLGR